MKIAVITNKINNSIGGIENYNRIFYERFAEEHEITEFPTLKSISSEDKVISEPIKDIEIDKSLLGWKPYKRVWGGTYTKNNYEKIFHNYDVVLLSCSEIPKKWLKHPKAVLVQHMDKTTYSLGGKHFTKSIKQFFLSLLFGVGTFTNSFKNAKYSMFYAEESRAFTKGESFYAALPAKKVDDIKIYKAKRKGFIWMARLEQKTKNLKYAIELANKNDDVSIYGAGEGIELIHKMLVNKNQFGGKVERKNVDKTLGSAKALLLTSSFEGFAFTVSEALSNGTPVILFDTFDVAKLFFKSNAVFVIPKNDKKAYEYAMNRIRNMSDEEYSKMQENAVNFSKEFLSKEAFWESWEKALIEIKEKRI